MQFKEEKKPIIKISLNGIKLKNRNIHINCKCIKNNVSNGDKNIVNMSNIGNINNITNHDNVNNVHNVNNISNNNTESIITTNINDNNTTNINDNNTTNNNTTNINDNNTTNINDNNTTKKSTKLLIKIPKTHNSVINTIDSTNTIEIQGSSEMECIDSDKNRFTKKKLELEHSNITTSNKNKLKITLNQSILHKNKSNEASDANKNTPNGVDKPNDKIIDTKNIKLDFGKKTLIYNNEIAYNELIHTEYIENKPVYNIYNGFMLANSFYDSDTGVPIVIPNGWFISEKYDGIRVIWDGVNFWTRNLTQIMAPEWFKNRMPKNLALDGELFIKRGYFNETSGYIRKKEPIDSEWKQIKYLVFDIPNSSQMLEDRLDHLKRFITDSGHPLYYIEHIKVNNINHLKNIHNNLIEKGAEGTILREPHTFYSATRSKSFLKIKDQPDEDAYILDWEEGNNNNKGFLGALWVKWVNPEEIHEKYNTFSIPYLQFRVGSGFKDHERCSIKDAYKYYPKNGIIKLGFNGLQNSGKPRHPVFKGIK